MYIGKQCLLSCNVSGGYRQVIVLLCGDGNASNGNIFRGTGPLWGESTGTGLLCGEFTGHRSITLTRASDAVL